MVVSQYFYPEQFRINDMAAEWVKRGYKVTVLTGIPNYPQGKFYKGYGWLKKRKETINGVEVIRIPLIARGKSKIGLVLNYLSFVFSGFFWKSFTRLKADIVFTFEVSPMTQALIGVWFAKRRKIPHYIYVQDLWPENVQMITGISSPIVITPISKMVNYIYKNSDMIFATSPSFVKVIEERVGKECSEVVYWPQYAEEFYVPLPKQPVDEIPDDGKFKVVFTGNIGQAQGLQILPVAARLLKEKGMHDVSFVIVGDGRHKQALLDSIKNEGVADSFLMIDRKPPEDIPRLLSACDTAFISFADDPIFKKTIPAKLQSYMACGMPIIAAATGETQRIVEEAECGLCTEMGDAKALAESIIYMKEKGDLRGYSKRAKAFFDKNFSKKMLMDEMDLHLAKGIGKKKKQKIK